MKIDWNDVLAVLIALLIYDIAKKAFLQKAVLDNVPEIMS